MPDAPETPAQTVRAALTSPELVRATATGRRKGQPLPQVAGRDVRRVELRPVTLKSGAHLQVVSYDQTQAHTSNHAVGDDTERIVDALLAEAFANWHVETTTQTLQVRVTKKGEWLLHTSEREGAPAAVDTSHDRDKQRVIAPDAPVLRALGISDAHGRIKPTRQAKYRQVEEFVRLLDQALTEALEKGHLRTPSADDPLRIVDLGCGNAYLTFAAHTLLSERLPIAMIGVDVKQQSADHNTAVARQLGIEASFVVGTIADATLDRAPDVVLALHACDTATDDALARAVEWQAALVLAAPCCHHDISAQLRAAPTPEPYAMLTRHGILRERFADTLTDALRASLLRAEGYKVDVVEFVESAHTPRNTLVRAVRTGHSSSRDEYDQLVETWQVHPRLGELLQIPGTQQT